MGGFALGLTAAFVFFPTVLGALGYASWKPLLVVPIACAAAAGLAVSGMVMLVALLLRTFGPRLFQRLFSVAQMLGIGLGSSWTPGCPRA